MDHTSNPSTAKNERESSDGSIPSQRETLEQLLPHVPVNSLVPFPSELIRQAVAHPRYRTDEDTDYPERAQSVAALPLDMSRERAMFLGDYSQVEVTPRLHPGELRSTYLQLRRRYLERGEDLPTLRLEITDEVICRFQEALTAIKDRQLITTMFGTIPFKSWWHSAKAYLPKELNHSLPQPDYEFPAIHELASLLTWRAFTSGESFAPREGDDLETREKKRQNNRYWRIANDLYSAKIRR